jgi:hypothetical protein
VTVPFRIVECGRPVSRRAPSYLEAYRTVAAS